MSVHSPITDNGGLSPDGASAKSAPRETREVRKAVSRLIRAIGRRVAAEDPEDLRELVTLEQDLAVAWATAIEGQRTTGFSDTQIGVVLGVSKQAVAQRWPRGSA